jgi:hypothetical protein
MPLAARQPPTAGGIPFFCLAFPSPLRYFQEMRTYIFIPPVKKATGGVAVLYQMAACLRDAGFDVRAVPREGDGPTPYQDMNVPTLAWDDLALTSEDIWLVPEGWVNALAPGLKADARCVVYCQNWAYLFSSLPPDVRWNQLRVSFLAVSHPVAWYMEQALGIETPPILRPGIDRNLFPPRTQSFRRCPWRHPEHRLDAAQKQSAW